MMNFGTTFSLVAAVSLGVASCGHYAPRADTAMAVDYDAVAAAAIAHPERLAGDAEDDERRQAAATIAFAQIAPGDVVFEIESGGGYWTEMFSRAVEPGGEVVMQNPAGFIPYVEDDLARRFADGRLPNVRRPLSPFDDLDAPDGSVDVATWIQGPHDLFHVPPDGEHLGDPEASFAEVFRIVAPGGAFVTIDHAALEGAPSSSGEDLHRIDAAIIIAMAEAAGFTLEESADFLRNPDDSREIVVFDPSIRGRTDQFALRFRKPE